MQDVFIIYFRRPVQLERFSWWLLDGQALGLEGGVELRSLGLEIALGLAAFLPTRAAADGPCCLAACACLCRALEKNG